MIHLLVINRQCIGKGFLIANINNILLNKNISLLSFPIHKAEFNVTVQQNEYQLFKIIQQFQQKITGNFVYAIYKML